MNADLLQGFYLGDLHVEPLRGRVTGRTGSTHLPPKAVEVLLSLASSPGQLVTRDTLLEEVWGADLGSQEALSHAVGEIRHALHDHHEDPEFVQTLPKRGYRLLITPEPESTTTSSVVLGAKSGVRATGVGLLENLRQRGVLEAAFAYLIVGWLIIQIADIVFDQLLLPQWIGTFVTVLVIAGFPIAIVLSWYLEFRDGSAVLHELSPSDARQQRFSRTYLSVVAALGIAAIFVFAYDKSIGLPEAETPTVAVVSDEIALPPVLENSIAVLPFVNIDGSNNTQVFANGLVDDVITRLSHVPGLLVSSRGDSSTLAPNSMSRRVRDRLRVALYVEGSVQIAGDQMRIIVQLIDSETGFHVLSRSFDRPREDFFDVRDEITELTVANVRVALPPVTQKASRFQFEDPGLDVYLLYRRGVDVSRQPKNIESIRKALEWFDAALEIDSDYAAAHAGKCTVYADGYPVADDPLFIVSAEASCARALELNSNLDVVHAALGDLYRATGRIADAEFAYREGIRINPSSLTSLIGLGLTYMNQQKPNDAEAIITQAIGLHPGDWSAYNTLGSFYFRSGRYAEAAAQYEYVVALDRSNGVGYSNLGSARMLAGDFAAAASALQKAIEIAANPSAYSTLGLVNYYLGQFDKAIDSLRQAVQLAPGDHLSLSNLGDALWVAGEHDEALRAFESAEKLASNALQVNPNDPNFQMDLAWINAMLDKNAEARTLIDRARARAPDDPYVYYIDGLILLRNGDTEAALTALETAAEKGYSLTLLAAEPQLEALRQHPRFTHILTHTNPP